MSSKRTFLWPKIIVQEDSKQIIFNTSDESRTMNSEHFTIHFKTLNEKNLLTLYDDSYKKEYTFVWNSKHNTFEAKESDTLTNKIENNNTLLSNIKFSDQNIITSNVDHDVFNVDYNNAMYTYISEWFSKSNLEKEQIASTTSEKAIRSLDKLHNQISDNFAAKNVSNEHVGLESKHFYNENAFQAIKSLSVLLEEIKSIKTIQINNIYWSNESSDQIELNDNNLDSEENVDE